METGITAGLWITLLGMAIVFCFIALLALTISLLSRLKGEESVPVAARPDELIAVIGAALHAHRSAVRRAERRE
jgi:Na+-transporting methylmalonyl-CoA/oxaloacetate decarboxylase gamma subunit